MADDDAANASLQRAIQANEERFQARQGVAEATDQLGRARTAETAALLIRDQATWDLNHKFGWPLERIANAQRDALLARGHTEQEISGSGVGYNNVAKICRRPRPV